MTIYGDIGTLIHGTMRTEDLEEITPQMVSAGQEAWMDWSEASDFSTERLVVTIYRAMRAAANNHKDEHSEEHSSDQPDE